MNERIVALHDVLVLRHEEFGGIVSERVGPCSSPRAQERLACRSRPSEHGARCRCGNLPSATCPPRARISANDRP